MKNIKQIILGVLLVLLVGITMNVKASLPPYYWTVDGKEMTENNDTATLVRDGKVNTLKLNNYSGKGIKLECYGTGQTDMQFIIELSGNNVINDDNIGIDFTAGSGNGKITFKGDCTLTI